MNVSQMLSRSISIFGFEIYWYAIIIVCGMMAAFGVISLLFKRRNMSTDLFLTFFVICLPIAIVTTRLFYCITAGMPIKDWFNFESIRQGGLAITGGILGGALSVMAVCFFKKVNFFRAGDCIVVGLLLAQSIGRWGNFVNQEVYGDYIDASKLKFLPSFIENNLHLPECFDYEIVQPLFLYESLLTTLGFILITIVLRRLWKNRANGSLGALYLAYYGIVRIILEPFRQDEYIMKIWGNVSQSVMMSALFIIAGVALLLVLNIRKKMVKTNE